MNKRDYLEELVSDLDNIKVILKEIGQDEVYWLNVTQNREVVGCFKYDNEHQGCGSIEICTVVRLKDSVLLGLNNASKGSQEQTDLLKRRGICTFKGREVRKEGYSSWNFGPVKAKFERNVEKGSVNTRRHIP